MKAALNCGSEDHSVAKDKHGCQERRERGCQEDWIRQYQGKSMVGYREICSRKSQGSKTDCIRGANQ